MSTLARPVLVIAGVALVADLVIYAVARIAGVDFVVTQGGRTETINAVMVAVMSVVPVLVGGLALLVTRRWAPTSWRVLAWLGLVVGIVSVPVLADATTGTKLALSPMHVVVGAVWFVVVRRLLLVDEPAQENAAGRGTRSASGSAAR